MRKVELYLHILEKGSRVAMNIHAAAVGVPVQCNIRPSQPQHFLLFSTAQG